MANVRQLKVVTGDMSIKKIIYIMEKLRKTHLRMSDIAAILDELKYNSIVPRDYTPDLSKLRIKNCVSDLDHYKAKTEASTINVNNFKKINLL